ncbi:hypothetical protein QR680_002971 [Steinernema hermaphroditum]|uniref:ABC1 atypical kinase-like domain-containing protein n=1 Tax=Steinernema hermaphroditum TaxID=289476 RepID=A0AA39H4V3_9BILA|nr:hypothetical protein QR680_002971 [Steinernema hermaphroditum]
MFLNNFVTVAKKRRMGEDFFVPGVFRELPTKRVLATEFIEGKPVDKCMEESQVVRDYIVHADRSSLVELFLWKTS